MRIVLDLQALQTESKLLGIGRYSLSFAQEIIKISRKHQYIILLNNSMGDLDYLEDQLDFENVEKFNVPTPISSQNSGNIWRNEAAELVREHFIQELHPDWVHISSLFEGWDNESVTSIGRFCKIPTSVTLYDLSPLVYLERYSADPLRDLWYRQKLEYLKNSDLLFTISDYSSRKAIEILNLPSEKVINISIDADRYFKPTNPNDDVIQKIRERYSINRPFIIYAGDEEFNESIDCLIEAFSRLSNSTKQTYQLVFTGNISETDRNRATRYAIQLGLPIDNIVFTGHLNTRDLVTLYGIGRLLVSISEREGFCLPLLEAMRCGLPVIGSNSGSVPEIIQLSSALFNRNSAESIRDAIQYALVDENFRKLLHTNSLRRMATFSWTTTAERALGAIEKSFSTMSHPSIEHQNKHNREKPLLAYVSPLPPEKSGISEYSTDLLPELAKFYNIDLITNLPKIIDSTLSTNFKKLTVSAFEKNYGAYDRIVYQMGNSEFHISTFDLISKYPGTVVLHDFFLSNVLNHMEHMRFDNFAFRRELYVSHGYPSLRYLRQHGEANSCLKYPCCGTVLRNAQGVILHSRHAIELMNTYFALGERYKPVQIPELYKTVNTVDKLLAREKLGIPADIYLICSFGIIAPSKLDERILEAYIHSNIFGDKQCHLLFVGDDSGPEGVKLRQRIKEIVSDDRIAVTGYVDRNIYQLYLDSADLAIQLRTNSRGETSRSVLDCMAHGLPTIVNCHGSLGEIPTHLVYTLPDQFENEQLSITLELFRTKPDLSATIGRVAKEYVTHDLNPTAVAGQYFRAIEDFAFFHPLAVQNRLIFAINQLPAKHSISDLALTASSIAENAFPAGSRRMFFDITAVARNGGNTGIQRVVRAILEHFVRETPLDYRLEPVLRIRGCYRYARNFMTKLLDIGETGLEDAPIDVKPGDIFISLDLDTGLGSDNVTIKWLQRQRVKGLKVYFTVYDLFPILRPDWFPRDFCLSFDTWFHTIVNEADGLICDSGSVLEQIHNWIISNPTKRQAPISIGYFHLGADLETSLPSNGISSEDTNTVEKLANSTSFLMVGIVFNRKGHSQALDAMEELWAQGEDIKLVIAGVEGQSMHRLTERIRKHKEFGRRLIWFNNASDQLLTRLYVNTSALLVASEGEGFGIPIMEAAKYGLPIIARDLPVFREVAGNSLFYFNGLDGNSLANSIKTWLQQYRCGTHPRSENIKWLTWKESAKQLENLIIGNHWSFTWKPPKIDTII